MSQLIFIPYDHVFNSLFIDIQKNYAIAHFSLGNVYVDLREYDNAISAYQKSIELNLNHLSIGMSSDYEIALENNSTFIRLGTAIFGSRKN